MVDSFPAVVGVLAVGGLVGVGLLHFGVAMHRGGIMPRWAIVLTFGVGLTGLGTELWKRSDPSMPAP